jgi:hypothetical protein
MAKRRHCLKSVKRINYFGIPGISRNVILIVFYVIRMGGSGLNSVVSE